MKVNNEKLKKRKINEDKVRSKIVLSVHELITIKYAQVILNVVSIFLNAFLY